MSAGKRKIVLASRNQDKLREMRELCDGLPFEVASSLDYPGLPEIIEDGTTVVGNASRKAIVTAAYTGEIAVADDTSLQVRALNNLPDIFASRFAGPEATYADNVRLLVDLMSGVPDGHRQARFVTAAVWVDPRPEAGGLADAPAPVQVEARWLHNPFARAIHVRDAALEPRFWNDLADRRAAWEQYRADFGELLVTQGADHARLAEVFARLISPYLGGGRPAGAPAGALHMPDTRLWTAAGRGDPAHAGAPTVVCPSGLPADAPGRAVNEAVWFELAAEGRVEGKIAREPQGEAGFGYDPVFRPGGVDRSFAELAPQEKNTLSHRGRALRRLLDAVGATYGATV